MRIPLLTTLLKLRLGPEIDDGLENILDIKGENGFLWLVLTILSAGLAILALHMLLHPNRKEIVLLSTPCGNVGYADEPSSEAIQAEKPPRQEEGLAGVKNLLFEKIALKVVRTKRKASGLPSSRSSALLPPGLSSGMVRGPASDGKAPADGEAKDKQQDLWAILDAIRNDPTRDLIEKTVQTGGIIITFHEATADGRVHFEVDNAGPGTVYLPFLEGIGVVKVLIERRVIEPGAAAQGVLSFKERRRTLDLTFKAANVAAYQFQVEVPQ